MNIKKKSLLLTILTVLTYAVLGSIIAGDGPNEFFGTVSQPWFALPLWTWILVAAAYYLLMGIILYKLLTDIEGDKRITLLFMLNFVLLYNELWNYIIFVNGSMLLAFLSLIPFVTSVVILYVLLRHYRHKLSLFLIPYLLWLVYDLAWTFGLWKLN